MPNSATAAPLRDSIFWSPDSKQLVRGAASGADVFDVTTGASRRLCACRYVGGSWNDAGTILLGGFGDRPGISRLTLADPQPVAITTADASRGEQDTWPVFLPDGRRFLFTRVTRGGETATFVGTLDGQPPRRIADGSLRIIVPASGGGDAYVLGVDAAGVVTQPFDLTSASVTGPAVTVAAGAVAVSASQNGVLATSTAGTRPRTIPTWFDRKGSPLGSIGDAAAIEGLALSADGRKLLTSEPNGDARRFEYLAARPAYRRTHPDDIRRWQHTRVVARRQQTGVHRIARWSVTAHSSGPRMELAVTSRSFPIAATRGRTTGRATGAG